MSDVGQVFQDYRTAWREVGHVVFGTPEDVAKRLQTLQATLGLFGFIMELNLGGRIPLASVLESIRLFGQEVAPQLRA
jgi:alkanesulfonate monooxygenase SsuD/methylene tetrahydromethanopterin reductase-like flavin-dependent oxidoreductase (luciferase family)